MTIYVLYALPVVLALSALVLGIRALVASRLLTWLAVVLGVASVALAVASVVIVRDVVTGFERAFDAFSEPAKDAPSDDSDGDGVPNDLDPYD